SPSAWCLRSAFAFSKSDTLFFVPPCDCRIEHFTLYCIALSNASENAKSSVKMGEIDENTPCLSKN
ncbi:MAG: hypothetical protein ACLVB4_11175, partial [Butyricicoccus sp.]|uniref:hypothetical protein n=1 Tax=Agathobaculum butyriciproducens TaxID=1628085 RepID=UPI001D0837C8|nr:hypothetical protein [Agathobaculum butyriciproducens]